jgi:hypothetical protein
MDEENGEKTGEKKDDKRDKKGQFVKGHIGGPGRGHKKEKQIELDGELLGMIEQVVKTGLNADDLKDRLKAAGIGIRVQSMKKSDDADIGYDSFITRWLDFVWDIANARFNKTGIPTSGKDVLIEMCKVCVDCDRLGTTSIDPDFKIVEPASGEGTGSGSSF